MTGSYKCKLWMEFSDWEILNCRKKVEIYTKMKLEKANEEGSMEMCDCPKKVQWFYACLLAMASL